MKIVLFICIVLNLAGKVKAQSKYSQFYNSKIVINPAFTGNFNQSYRIAVVSRAEQTTRNDIVNSNYFSIDGKLFQKFNNPFDVFSIGIVLNNEGSKIVGWKNTNFISSISFNKSLSEDGNTLATIGVSTNFGRRVIDPIQFASASELTNWLNKGFLIENVFSFQGTSFNYFDINLGALFQGSFKANNFFLIGGSINNALAKTVIFQGGQFKLERELNIYGDYELRFNNKDRMNYNLTIDTRKGIVNFLSTGLKYQLNITKFTKVHFGGFYKKFEYRDFVTPILGIKYGKLNFTCSFDLNINKSKLNRRGGFELSLIVINAKNKNSFYENRFINQ